MRLLCVAAALLALAGCGYVGEPLPPLANIPARVQDLSAVQRGANLMVQFTAPQLTTEGRKITSGVEFELRAGPAPSPFNESAWLSSAKTAKPSAIEDGRVQYVLPAAEWANREIVVGVRVIGRNLKNAGWSNFAVVPVVPAPPRPRQLLAEPVAGGVRLTWVAEGNLFRVFRRTGEDPFAAIANPQTQQYTDGSVETGRPYTYLVQTIVKTGDRESESDASAEVTVTPVDLFPPAVPAGIRIVISTASIELAWEPDADADLAGYRVYRAAPGGDFARLAEVSGGPSYSDRTAEPGKLYRYAITAFDKAGNESARSQVIEGTLP